jgi:O-antigen/teichoic acid export membrane protein
MKRGLLWSAITVLITTAGSLAVTPALIHHLGAAEYGLYVLVLVMASYAGFMDFGLTWASTRYFARDLAENRHADLVSRFRTLQICLGLVGLASALFALTLGPSLLHASGIGQGRDVITVLLLAASSFALVLQGQLHASLLRADQRFEETGKIAALAGALLPLATVVVIWAAPRLFWLLLANALVNVAVLLVYTRANRHLLTGGLWRFNFRYLRQMASFSGWSTVSRLIMTVILQVDRLAVALIGTVSGLTYYSVPANLASRVNVLGGPVAGMFFARASFLFAAGDELELRRQHARATRFLLWAVPALSLPLIILGKRFLSVWIGPEMATRGTPILIAFTIGYLINSVTSIDAVLIEASGRASWTAMNMLVFFFPALAVVLIFSRQWGAQAVGFAAAGWLAAVGITNMVLRGRLLPNRLGTAWAGCLAAALPSVFIGYMAQRSLSNTIQVLASMAAIGALALATGFFTTLNADDRAICVNSVLRRSRTPLPAGELEKTNECIGRN